MDIYVIFYFSTLPLVIIDQLAFSFPFIVLQPLSPSAIEITTIILKLSFVLSGPVALFYLVYKIGKK